ncbi:hypothetical protein MXB_5129, partial [Myxobolus squamalis]
KITPYKNELFNWRFKKVKKYTNIIKSSCNIFVKKKNLILSHKRHTVIEDILLGHNVKYYKDKWKTEVDSDPLNLKYLTIRKAIFTKENLEIPNLDKKLTFQEQNKKFLDWYYEFNRISIQDAFKRYELECTLIPGYNNRIVNFVHLNLLIQYRYQLLESYRKSIRELFEFQYSYHMLINRNERHFIKSILEACNNNTDTEYFQFIISFFEFSFLELSMNL